MIFTPDRLAMIAALLLASPAFAQNYERYPSDSEPSRYSVARAAERS